MAIMDDAKILLLDEPSAALDPKTSEIIMQKSNQIIKEFKLTAILITHNLKDAANYGERIILMKEGSIAHDYKGDVKIQLSLQQMQDWF
jgi:putative ABC transport system ATP-binding protein